MTTLSRAGARLGLGLGSHTGSTTMTGEGHAAADRLYEQITNPA